MSDLETDEESVGIRVRPRVPRLILPARRGFMLNYHQNDDNLGSELEEPEIIVVAAQNEPADIVIAVEIAPIVPINEPNMINLMGEPEIIELDDHDDVVEPNDGVEEDEPIRDEEQNPNDEVEEEEQNPDDEDEDEEPIDEDEEEEHEDEEEEPIDEDEEEEPIDEDEEELPDVQHQLAAPNGRDQLIAAFYHVYCPTCRYHSPIILERQTKHFPSVMPWIISSVSRVIQLSMDLVSHGSVDGNRLEIAIIDTIHREEFLEKYSLDLLPGLGFHSQLKQKDPAGGTIGDGALIVRAMVGYAPIPHIPISWPSLVQSMDMYYGELFGFFQTVTCFETTRMFISKMTREDIFLKIEYMAGF